MLKWFSQKEESCCNIQIQEVQSEQKEPCCGEQTEQECC